MAKRNLNRSFYTPKTIQVLNPDNGYKVDCDVIEYTESKITAAVNGIKLVLNRNSQNVFEGRMAGMTLIFKEDKK